MKRLFLSIALFGFIFTTSAYAQDQMLNRDQLPDQIKEYVQEYFPNSKIVKTEMEKEIFGPAEYEVTLNNRTEIEFEDTSMVKVESNSKLPEGVIPDKIAAYVNSNY